MKLQKMVNNLQLHLTYIYTYIDYLDVFVPNCGYGNHLRFPSLRSSGLQQEWVSSPFSSASSRIVVTVVAWADGTAPAACSVQL